MIPICVKFQHLHSSTSVSSDTRIEGVTVLEAERADEKRAREEQTGQELTKGPFFNA